MNARSVQFAGSTIDLSTVVSLVCVVLIATLGAGWAIDRLFTNFSAAPSPEFFAWRMLGRDFADVVAGMKDPDAAITDLESGQLVPVEVLGVGPDAQLAGALRGPEGLALESDQGVTVYYALTYAGRSLVLSYPTEQLDSSGLRLVLTIAFYLSLVVLVVAWLLPLLKRLGQLTDAARAFGAGELKSRVATGPRSE